MDVSTGSGNRHRLKQSPRIGDSFSLWADELFSSQAQFKKRRGRVSPTPTAFSCKLYFVGFAAGKEFQQQHRLVQGSGCIQLAHPCLCAASDPLQKDQSGHGSCLQ